MNVYSLLLLGAMTALAQEEMSRQLWLEEFVSKRPPAKTVSQGKSIVYRKVPTSSSAAVQAPSAPPPTQAKAPEPAAPERPVIIGVSFWRLRPPKQGDAPGTRLLVLPGGDERREEVPERIEVDTPLSPGDRIRVAVEVPFNGYLYITDRERYSDGSHGNAYLIYPNWRTRPGDNVTAPGRLIEIPNQRENPNVFLIQPHRTDLVAEELSILVAPEPIATFQPGGHVSSVRQPILIDQAQYAEWEQNWGIKAETFELQNAAGTTWTTREREAGAHTRMLTQDDPLPQTLYRVRAKKPGEAILMGMTLRVAH